MRWRGPTVGTDSAFGQRLRLARKRMGLTQVQLAARAGVNQGFLSELERGRRGASVSTVRALAGALGLPEGVLVGEGREHDAPQVLDTRELPLLGSIPAGTPSQSQEQ